MLAKRMSRLGTETAFEVLARAKELERQGRSIIHLQIGEPDFDTPRNIVDAACKALQEGWTHYGPAPGQPPDSPRAIYTGLLRWIGESSLGRAPDCRGRQDQPS